MYPVPSPFGVPFVASLGRKSTGPLPAPELQSFSPRLIIDVVRPEELLVPPEEVGVDIERKITNKWDGFNRFQYIMLHYTIYYSVELNDIGVILLS